jgi:nucleotide-binding universal stress UspA family protein
MTTAGTVTQVAMKRILYLTDFSPSSEAALPFAAAVARQYGGSIEVLHALTPVIPESCSEAAQADEELAEIEMKNIRPRIADIPCETRMIRGKNLWDAIDETIREHRIDLLVAGTHGRTGLPKLLLGSVAEEVFRRSPVPVLTVGPHVRSNVGGHTRFERVLFATDFSPESEAGAPYALSLARENKAELILLHVMPEAKAHSTEGVNAFEASVAKAVDGLRQIVSADTALYNKSEVLIEYGEPAERIVEVAKERDVDLIVLGVRDAAAHLGAATHLERATAHKVVTHAACPVLTVRDSKVDGRT